MGLRQTAQEHMRVGVSGTRGSLCHKHKRNIEQANKTNSKGDLKSVKKKHCKQTTKSERHRLIYTGEAGRVN